MNTINRFLRRPAENPVQATPLNNEYISRGECNLNMEHLKAIIAGLEKDKIKLTEENRKINANTLQQNIDNEMLRQFKENWQTRRKEMGKDWAEKMESDDRYGGTKKQNKTKQNKTKQNKTKQNKTYQKN